MNDNAKHNKAEWAREKQITTQFGLTHTILYRLRREGRIRTLSLRDEGKRYGARLFNVASVREYLATQEAKEVRSLIAKSVPKNKNEPLPKSRPRQGRKRATPGGPLPTPDADVVRQAHRPRRRATVLKPENPKS